MSGKIRTATPADHAQIALICLLTGATGTDATGKFCDDAALADVYATPYLHGPGGFALVWDVGGEARGYVVGTSDTRAFQDWFTGVWWPRVGSQRVGSTEGDAWLLPEAGNPARLLIPEVDDFPAHLHIDLLPDQQGRGAGTLLIEAAVELVAERGVPGVHLVAETANSGAQAFYPRVGFRASSHDDGSVTFVRSIDVRAR